MTNFTDIIIVSKKRNALYSLKLNLGLVALIPVIFVGIISFTVILFLYNAREIYKGINVYKIEQKHEMLLRKLDSLNTEITLAQNDFENYIARDNRERTFWQMPHIHPDIWSMGIGGSELQRTSTMLSKGTEHTLNQIYEAIDILKGKLYLRKVSLEDIEDQIESSIHLWSHIPSIHPVPGKELGSGFGYRVDPIDRKTIKMHWGLDIGAPRGTPINVTADGMVSCAEWHTGYGKTVEIDHGYGFKTRYGHCQRILVKEGDFVKRGQVIATVGNTGRSIAPHLHYEVQVSGVKVNPKRYIDLSHVVFD